MAIPPKPPHQKPGLAAVPTAEDAIAKARREKDALEAETGSVEEELEALKARYEMYFLGVERREPNRWRDDVKKKVMRLKGAFTRNTGLKFRIQSLHARYISYERLWLRSAREKEEGTYRRDLFKARLRAKHGDAKAPEPKKDEATQAEAAPAAASAAPAVKSASASTPAQTGAAATPRKAAPASPPPGAMTDTQMRALYNAYLAAKMTCREDVSKLTYDAVAKSVSKQIPELMARFKAKSVEFKVEVKDGKAILKAIPKI